jgi:hypothetical protein
MLCRFRTWPSALRLLANADGFHTATGPLETGVVVLVSILVRGTRMQLRHGTLPLSRPHPSRGAPVRCNRMDHVIFFGTKDLPRAQGEGPALLPPLFSGSNRSSCATTSRGSKACLRESRSSAYQDASTPMPDPSVPGPYWRSGTCPTSRMN